MIEDYRGSATIVTKYLGFSVKLVSTRHHASTKLSPSGFWPASSSPKWVYISRRERWRVRRVRDGKPKRFSLLATPLKAVFSLAAAPYINCMCIICSLCCTHFIISKIDIRHFFPETVPTSVLAYLILDQLIHCATFRFFLEQISKVKGEWDEIFLSMSVCPSPFTPQSLSAPQINIFCQSLHRSIFLVN